MKTIFKRMSIMLLAFSVLSACGENKSGGGSSSKSSGIGNGQTGYTTQGENYSNIDEVRNQFSAKSMADGISDGETVYHVGSYFGGNSSGGGQVSVNVYGCLNLIFWQVGDCDSNSGYDPTSYLENALNLGRIWQVQGASGESISINEAYDVIGGNYIYQPQSFDRNNAKYRAMLGLDHAQNVKAVISNAQIKLSNNQIIPATFIEYFVVSTGPYGNEFYMQELDSFVVTKNLPVVANPVLVTKGYTIKGYLSNVGQNIRVKSITISRDNYINGNGTLTAIHNGQVNISY